ncbi:MAG: hypothetical protein IPG45_31115 [Deltaproteobacteria bacterium]|jgi:hypothetical protein|nr:hypothetical protein [Deltaproteobacteria bacterium]
MFRFLEVSLRSSRWILGLVVLLGLLAGGPLRGALELWSTDWGVAVDGAEAAEVECEDDEEVTLGIRPSPLARSSPQLALIGATAQSSLSGVASSLLRPPNA